MYMFQIRKPRARRVEIRKNRPDITSFKEAITDNRVIGLLAVVVVFWLAAVFITLLREQMVRHRPDEYAQQDIVSRVEFYYTNTERLVELQQAAREATPRVYRAVANPFAELQRTLLALPEDVTRLTAEQLLDSIAMTMEQKMPDRQHDRSRSRKAVQTPTPPPRQKQGE